MSKGIVIGFLFIVFGIGMYAYYDQYIRSGRDARELITEAKIHYERGDRESINSSINLFSKVIARYPGTRAEVESYYYIGQCYEKLGLRRLAYLKYLYILKNNHSIEGNLGNEIRARMAHLRIAKSNTDEGVHQLLTLLGYSSNSDFRSRVYTELGHTYLNMRNFQKSKNMFDIALNESGTNEDAILGKARVYKLTGNPNGAYDLYEYFLKYYGGFSQYTDDVSRSFLQQVYESGYYSYRQGHYHDAISFFRRLLNNFPNSRRSENALYWIGESHYALGQYDPALQYFGRVLSNSFSHKDEDAQIKKGCTYFMGKHFDLAAREFQHYLNRYPNGRHLTTARQWKDMSTREMLYRIRDKMLPDEEEGEEGAEKSSSGVSGRIRRAAPPYEKENIAEL